MPPATAPPDFGKAMPNTVTSSVPAPVSKSSFFAAAPAFVFASRFAVTVPDTGCTVAPVGSTRKGFAAAPSSPPEPSRRFTCSARLAVIRTAAAWSSAGSEAGVSLSTPPTTETLSEPSVNAPLSVFGAPSTDWTTSTLSALSAPTVDRPAVSVPSEIFTGQAFAFAAGVP